MRLEVDALVQAALRADDTAVQACLSHFTGLPYESKLPFCYHLDRRILPVIYSRTGHSLDEVSSDGNSTPLLAAIRGGDWNIIHEILLRDANPNFPSPVSPLVSLELYLQDLWCISTLYLSFNNRVIAVWPNSPSLSNTCASRR